LDSTTPPGVKGQSREGAPAGLIIMLAPVAALLFSVGFLLMGNGLQNTLLPVRGSLENFRIIDIALLGSAYYAGFAIGCLFGPAVIMRAGHVRAFMAMTSIASVTALVHAVVVDPLLWWVLRAMAGACFAILYTVIESWLNEKSTNTTRGTVFSVYLIINLTVITIGQLMIGLGDPSAFPLFALSSILVSLAAIPLAFTSASTPEPVPAVKLSIRRLYATSPVGIMGCFASGLANGAFWGLGPLFAEDAGFSTAGIGVMMSAVVLGGAIAQWPLGTISDRIDRRLVMLVAIVLAVGAGLLLVSIGPANRYALLGLGMVFGAGAFPLYALAVAHANDYAEPSRMVEISSGLLLVQSIGSAAGPVLASGVTMLHPSMGLFAFTVCVHLLFAGFIAIRLMEGREAEDADRVTFAEAAVAAQMVSSIEIVEEDAAENAGDNEDEDETSAAGGQMRRTP
jgi:MFS family permease